MPSANAKIHKITNWPHHAADDAGARTACGKAQSDHPSMDWSEFWDEVTCRLCQRKDPGRKPPPPPEGYRRARSGDDGRAPRPGWLVWTGTEYVPWAPGIEYAGFECCVVPSARRRKTLAGNVAELDRLAHALLEQGQTPKQAAARFGYAANTIREAVKAHVGRERWEAYIAGLKAVGVW